MAWLLPPTENEGQNEMKGELNLTITSDCSDDDFRQICRGLIAYNYSESGGKIDLPCDEDIRLALKDPQGKVLGGISGHIALYCWFIEELWLDKRAQGKGYGRRILKKGEDIAREKGCRIAQTNTFTFQSPGFYASQGYEEIAVVDVCEGVRQLYFYKQL